MRIASFTHPVFVTSEVTHRLPSGSAVAPATQWRFVFDLFDLRYQPFIREVALHTCGIDITPPRSDGHTFSYR